MVDKHTNILKSLNELVTNTNEIKKLLQLQKAVLTLEEFCLYAGLSKNQVYHLTAEGKVKFYRPFGKKIYFDRLGVEEFLKQNATQSNKGVAKKSNNYFLKK